MTKLTHSRPQQPSFLGYKIQEGRRHTDDQKQQIRYAQIQQKDISSGRHFRVTADDVYHQNIPCQPKQEHQRIQNAYYDVDIRHIRYDIRTGFIHS